MESLSFIKREMKNVSFYAEIGSGELKGTSFKLSKDIVLVFDGKGDYVNER